MDETGDLMETVNGLNVHQLKLLARQFLTLDEEKQISACVKKKPGQKKSLGVDERQATFHSPKSNYDLEFDFPEYVKPNKNKFRNEDYDDEEEADYEIKAPRKLTKKEKQQKRQEDAEFERILEEMKNTPIEDSEPAQKGKAKKGNKKGGKTGTKGRKGKGRR